MANPLDGPDGSLASPGPGAPGDELRRWSANMFAQHAQILRDVFARVVGEPAEFSQRVVQLEQGHREAARLVTIVAAGTASA